MLTKETLRRRRKALDLTLADIASGMGVAICTVYTWERRALPESRVISLLDLLNRKEREKLEESER